MASPNAYGATGTGRAAVALRQSATFNYQSSGSSTGAPQAGSA